MFLGEILGRGNPKGGKKGRKTSKSSSTPTPPTPPPPQSVEEVKLAQPVAAAVEIPSTVEEKDVVPATTSNIPVAAAVNPVSVVDSSSKVDVEIKVIWVAI